MTTSELRTVTVNITDRALDAHLERVRRSGCAHHGVTFRMPNVELVMCSNCSPPNGE